MKKFDSFSEYLEFIGRDPGPETSGWTLVDPSAVYPFEIWRAVRRLREYRVFYAPEAGGEKTPWILAVRELGDDGVPALIHHQPYPSQAPALAAGEQMEGPDW